MSQDVYISIKGAAQGKITGGVIQKGREGQIAAYAYHHEIISPRDPASGLPTGKRQHKPLVITKEIDRSTPLLHQALVTNETLTEVVLRFYALSHNGLETQVYTITLTNANISEISQDMSLNKIEPGTKLPVLEEISFIYQKITWTWTEAGLTASDDWQALIPDTSSIQHQAHITGD